MRTSNKILIAGSGYVGNRLATSLRAQGHEAWCLRRTHVSNDPFALTADLSDPPTIQLSEISFSHVIFTAGLKSATATEYRALFFDGLNNLMSILTSQHTIQRFIFVSTTGVFNETNGGWVDEHTPPKPTRVSAQWYLEAEQLLQNYSIPSVVARLSGIYGPGRTRLIRGVRDNQMMLEPGPTKYLNHIHVDDAVTALTHLLYIPDPLPLYLLTDCEPADRNEVLCWLANYMDIPPPKQAIESAQESRRGGNKRCNNKRLLESGYTFKYPTYREGYKALIDAMD